jgi:branched-chain amino acid transport system substrate-binding protein
VINNDWGRGSADDFGKVMKSMGIQVGLVEIMDQAAQDMTAQLAKIKATDSDTIMVTTAVEQLTLVLKQAAALGITKKIVTTGGSQNPDQLIAQAGAAANGSMHLTTFAPWYPDKTPDPKATEYFLDQWKKRGFSFAGATESFRGYDGIRTILHAIQGAGKAEPDAITQALWKVDFTGLNGAIKFQKQGPSGRESGQSMPNLYLIKIEGGKVVLAES